jgi:predicted NAD/FAD-binding protein
VAEATTGDNTLSPKTNSSQTVAVIGGGVAGIVSAYLLQRRYHVTLFEKDDYLGGHTHTIEISNGPDRGLAVDTGFIVLNDKTYPLFEKFLSELGVATRTSEMSFGFQCRKSGLVYAGNNLNGLFTQRQNLVNPKFICFLRDIVRFCRIARKDLASGAVSGRTLDQYLANNRVSQYMVENYLLPIGAAIWSTPAAQIGGFPAEPFLRFFQNHGLLSLRNRPQWKTVVGGSHAYVKAFRKNFQGQVLLNGQVNGIRRQAERVSVEIADGSDLSFDHVVVATHADQALQILKDPSPLERQLLGPWRYQKNQTVLHTDATFLPAQKRAWAAWNFTRDTTTDANQPVFVTYYMNRLQGLRAEQDYCVTLNHPNPFNPDTVVAEMEYHHPLYSFDSMATQARLPELNGRRRTYFCGSYFGYGFHEDAVRSAVGVAKMFGLGI